MKIIHYRFFYAGALAAALCLGPFTAQAQTNEPIIIAPLFEYPIAPEELPDLRSKSDYLMEHFWTPMDFSVQSIDQNALNDAFTVYASAMLYASRDKALKSIDELIKRVKGNPTALYQITRAAEDSFYGPRAPLWSDEAYIPFLRALIGDKKLSDARKQRFAMQLEVLQNNSIGKKLPSLRLTRRDGVQTHFLPASRITLIEFGNPGCEDCRFAKTKLLMAADLEEFVEDGKLDIAFIVPDAIPEEQAELLSAFEDYPSSWLAGISYGADDILDLRSTPSFYILDEKGRIVAKNLGASDAVDRIRQLMGSK